MEGIMSTMQIQLKITFDLITIISLNWSIIYSRKKYVVPNGTMGY